MKRIVKTQNNDKKNKIARLIKSTNGKATLLPKKKISVFDQNFKKEVEQRIIQKKEIVVQKEASVNLKSGSHRLNSKSIIKNRIERIKKDYNDATMNKFEKRLKASFSGKLPHDVVIKDTIEYDTIIIISSFNRYEKLNNILSQLFNQDTKYKFKIIVYNDGSTIDYTPLKELFSEVVFIESSRNNAKKYYWKTITNLFQECRKYLTNSVIQIDDDFVLCENFIDNLINFYQNSLKTNPKVKAVGYHINPDHKENRWGFKNWVDGGSLYNVEFLKEISYVIEPIPEDRWDNNPTLSSGVWHQITKKIHTSGGLIVSPEKSFAYHDGNEDSKMNQNVRKNNKIKTKNFIDDNSNS